MWNPVLYRQSLSICFCVWEEMKTEIKNVCDKKTPTFLWLTSAPCAVLLLYNKCVFLLVFFSHTLPSQCPFFFSSSSSFLFFMAHSTVHYFSLSSHRGFSDLLPWAEKWAWLYFRTLTANGEVREPSSHQIVLSPQEKTCCRFFFLFPTSAFLLTLFKHPPMCMPKPKHSSNTEVHLLISKIILNCSFTVGETLIFLQFKTFFDISEASFRKTVSLMDLKHIPTLWWWAAILKLFQWFVVESCTLMLTWYREATVCK